MSYLKKISDFIIEKVLPIKFKVWLLDRLACDIANQGEDGDTELAFKCPISILDNVILLLSVNCVFNNSIS